MLYENNVSGTNKTKPTEFDPSIRFLEEAPADRGIADHEAAPPAPPWEAAGITFHDQPRRGVYDLDMSVNAYGRAIYVEEWEENTGRPKVWYEFNKQRDLLKHERKPAGIYISNLGKTHYL